MKTCTKCGVEKEEGCFYKMKASKDGLTCWCKECQKEYKKEYNKQYLADPEVKKRKREYDKELRSNSEVKEIARRRRKENRAKPGVKRRIADLKFNRVKSDPIFKLRCNVSTLIQHALENKGYSKKSKTRQLLGADYEFVKKHLENTWFQNYGTIYEGQKVHIDHIIPCASAKTEEELIALQHYTNLQYLTPEDNLKKSDSMPNENIS